MSNFLKIRELFVMKRIYTPTIMVTSIICSLLFTQVSVAANAVNADKATPSVNKQLVDQTNPYKMVEDAAQRTFKRFATEQKNIQENPNILKNIVREELMPYINYKYAAFKVIGKHLRKTTDEDRRAFVPVFREYLVTSYAQVFTLYDNQTVEFEPAKPLTEKSIVAVNSTIIMPGRDNIDVTFKVRIDKKTKNWQAYDMVAEGVSLLDSKQAELGSMIRQKGLPYVTELLKEKSAKDIVFKNGNESDAADK